ncbi:hypothetical protein N781_12980 [Pontibacillus halophilus JSM 076056 = DSM 19796]|uniref:Uncharacterized protein n=1 Tax=Pontibacillus halophilus JSM 076056 = DSM 19796 TaxID=1385510 RepID=A0A0A5GPY5_9BACI|nr:DUF5325 family protein [Pontibacillus halophilus]KGX93313.1 hypothetical protein N781_12980 [Pontibacillus halophilus JSM 076056 = DSM 19796]
MKRLDVQMLLLALLAVGCFFLTGVAIGYRNYLLTAFFLLLGFAVMGFGFTVKRKRRVAEA